MCDADPKCNAFTLDPHGKQPHARFNQRSGLSDLQTVLPLFLDTFCAREAVCRLAYPGKYLRATANWGGTCVGKTFCWTYASYKALHPGSSTFGSKGDLPPPPPKPAPGASCVMQQDFFGTVSRASHAARSPSTNMPGVDWLAPEP